MQPFAYWTAQKLHLRPDNTVAENLRHWSEYDWSRKGEEWSNADHPGWKNGVVEQVLKPNVPKGSRILEIGPGSGRWTQHLLEQASHLILVDLTPKCIEMCKDRFAEYDHIEYHVNNGRDLNIIESSSVDRIWSYDVFVHIQQADTEGYIQEFSRILAPGGRAIIHHGRFGKRDIGFRSDLTSEAMRAMCEDYGLKVIEQFEKWGGGYFRLWPNLPVHQNPDTISLIERPHS